MRGTQAVQLLRGIALIIAVSAFARLFELTALEWLIAFSTPALLTAIPVIFQPELRRGLERLGRAGNLTGWGGEQAKLEQMIDQVCDAVHRLSGRKEGALIVFEGETGLQDIVETGVQIDSIVTSELLQTIFFHNTALHDGAVIVRDHRITAASCVLPLTKNWMIDRNLGTRHRAAIGVTENTDALVVVVSEETGIISIARTGRIVRRLDEPKLRHILERALEISQPSLVNFAKRIWQS